MNSQTRYLEEITADVSLTEDVVFGSNYNPFLPINDVELFTDVYQPETDNETNRAAVILLHSGNFLPKYLNQSFQGTNKDSSIVASAQMFAKRGYVAFAPNYRLRWDPINQDAIEGADIRRGTLLNAVFRALQDVKTLVRFIKKTVGEEGNPYGVNPDRIIVYGQGSGGYLSLAYGSLDRVEELLSEPTGKWLSTVTTSDGQFEENQPYIDTLVVGGIDGFGGSINDTNHFGYTNDVVACINLGGALGDSAWIEPGEPPIISFHVPDDEFSPFTQGLVIVPTSQEVVVDVVGSRWAVKRANELGNNDVLYGSQPYTDQYTQAAEAALSSNHIAVASPIAGQQILGLNPAEYRGLFPFKRPPITNGWLFEEASPWQWWDEQTEIAAASQLLGPSGAQILHDNEIAGNPFMSPELGKAYLDSVHGYLAPRLHHLINSDVSVQESEFVEVNTFVYPNPASDFIVVKTKNGIRISNIQFFNITGALVRTENGFNKFSHQINGINNLPSGLYLVKVTTNKGIANQKILIK